LNATLGDFLENLFENGRVSVPAPRPLAADELFAADKTLNALEADYRLNLPGDAPTFDPAAARWAAVSIYSACGFVAYRSADEAMMDAAFAAPAPGAEPAALHYSVDLTMRFLPDLMLLARSEAENDPLLGHLRRWAGDWPLSSLGMSGVVPRSIEPVVNHACLLGVYCDRIIARKDHGRRNDPRVDEAVKQALGE
jgi:MoxR-vWA-beta-propeller ternary system domain bpX4